MSSDYRQQKFINCINYRPCLIVTISAISSFNIYVMVSMTSMLHQRMTKYENINKITFFYQLIMLLQFMKMLSTLNGSRVLEEKHSPATLIVFMVAAVI